MHKLIIQIPCYNEERSLPVTLAELPRSIPGVRRVEWLIVDDGSTDKTVDVARSHGVDHIVRLPQHLGLAKAFTEGLEACLSAGADIIVNIDADNQYCALDIPKLVAPILAGEAQIVVGTRPIASIAHFSPVKKFLQRFGSWVVRLASNTRVADAPSGFRAFHHLAARRLHVFSSYSYTLETIIQAGQKGISILSVPIRTNCDLRPSRLVKSLPSYVSQSLLTIIRIFVTYRPFFFFAIQGSIVFGLGLIIGLRFLCYFFLGRGQGHTQSLILCSIMIVIGALLVMLGLLADLMAVNRMLLERADWRLQLIESQLDSTLRATSSQEECLERHTHGTQREWR